MKPRTTLAAILACGLAMPLAAQTDRPATEGELELAEMLEGRVAGEPRNCILARPIRSTKIIDDTAIVYESGPTLYVNFTQDPRTLDDDDFLVTRTQGVSLCSSDQVTTKRRPVGFYSGNVILTQFIPYERVDDEG